MIEPVLVAKLFRYKFEIHHKFESCRDFVSSNAQLRMLEMMVNLPASSRYVILRWNHMHGRCLDDLLWMQLFLPSPFDRLSWRGELLLLEWWGLRWKGL